MLIGSHIHETTELLLVTTGCVMTVSEHILHSDELSLLFFF